MPIANSLDGLTEQEPKVLAIAEVRNQHIF